MEKRKLDNLGGPVDAGMRVRTGKEDVGTLKKRKFDGLEGPVDAVIRARTGKEGMGMLRKRKFDSRPDGQDEM